MLTAKINSVDAPAKAASAPSVRRITSANLLQDKREVEIEHEGKIYRLRVTQLNKLILTA
jgi:hemin uptake protein HemP